MILQKILLFLYNSLINTLLPLKCIRCGKKDTPFCDNCITRTKRAQRETEDYVMSVFDYRDQHIRKAIWELKYYNKRYLGEIFGKILYETFLEEISDMRLYSQGEKIIIIPVPISRKRKDARGYNQSMTIASSFSTKDEIFELQNNIIFKNKETLPQARIKSRNERLKNIKGAFSIKNKDIIKNRIIIIIDDVTTTGGTLTEIIKVLKKNGAKKVIALTIAH